MTEDEKQLVEESMCSTANFYAAQGNMSAATAIHDAFLVLMEHLEAGKVENKIATSEVKEW
jgi:hypothetical protein